mmetsp:Transcript_84098/g.233045  ORF Transcript_84098/g.233045 Transcript_84098/m.233045 type:complete len:266 (-) Transcript_84098:11-808(-)
MLSLQDVLAQPLEGHGFTHQHLETAVTLGDAIGVHGEPTCGVTNHQQQRLERIFLQGELLFQVMQGTEPLLHSPRNGKEKGARNDVEPCQMMVDWLPEPHGEKVRAQHATGGGEGCEEEICRHPHQERCQQLKGGNSCPNAVGEVRMGCMVLLGVCSHQGEDQDVCAEEEDNRCFKGPWQMCNAADSKGSHKVGDTGCKAKERHMQIPLAPLGEEGKKSGTSKGAKQHSDGHQCPGDQPNQWGTLHKHLAQLCHWLLGKCRAAGN